MWIWTQRAGELFRNDPSGAPDARGYSGHESGKNNPLAQHIARVGPIPQGVYLIGSPRDTPEHGPFVLPLIPMTGTQLFGRSGFLIHGDSRFDPGSASLGCIILERSARERIANSGDVLLVVLPGPAIERTAT